MTLTGAACYVFAFCTHFFIDLEVFSALQMVWFPTAAAVFAVIITVRRKEESKKERLLFLRPPLIAGAAAVLNTACLWIFSTAVLYTPIVPIACFAAWLICCAVRLTEA